VVNSNNVSIVHRFGDITAITVYVTAYDLESPSITVYVTAYDLESPSVTVYVT